jgi:tetratricopeptide (TPR) repeat protein
MVPSYLAYLRHSIYFEVKLRASYKHYLEGNKSLTKAFDDLDLDWENIHNGLTWAADNASSEQAAMLLSGYLRSGTYLLDIRLASSDHIQLLEQAISATQRFGWKKLEAEHLNRLGWRQFENGQNDDALSNFQKSLKIARETGERGTEGNAIGNIGNIYAARGEHRNGSKSVTR